MHMRKTILLSVLMATMLTGQQGRRVDDGVLRNAAKSGDEWLTYGQNPGETRYSPLTQIDATNVNRLGLAWSYDVGQGGGNQEATPLVWNGTLYGITNWSVVFAVDARTGRETIANTSKATSPRSTWSNLSSSAGSFGQARGQDLYVPVTDKATLQRLQHRLFELKDREA
jgi:glucose dehydrogenase